MKAPAYLSGAHVDALLSGLLLLTQEVAVLQHRVAALEADRAAAPEPGAPGTELTARIAGELADRAWDAAR